MDRIVTPDNKRSSEMQTFLCPLKSQCGRFGVPSWATCHVLEGAEARQENQAKSCIDAYSLTRSWVKWVHLYFICECSTNWRLYCNMCPKLIEEYMGRGGCSSPVGHMFCMQKGQIQSSWRILAVGKDLPLPEMLCIRQCWAQWPNSLTHRKAIWWDVYLHIRASIRSWRPWQEGNPSLSGSSGSPHFQKWAIAVPHRKITANS